MTQDLSKIIATTTNGRLRIRLFAVSHFKDGKNRTQIANFLKVSRTSVNKWIKSYLDDGLAGLQEKAHTGRPKGLTKLQLLQLKDFVSTTSIKPNGGRLQGKDIHAYIEAEFKVKYQKTNVYHLLHGLNLS